MTLQHATAGKAPAPALPLQGCSRESGRADPRSPGLRGGSAGAGRASPPWGAATSFPLHGRGRVRACPPPFLLFPRLPNLTLAAACLARAVQPPRPSPVPGSAGILLQGTRGEKGPSCPPPAAAGRSQPAPRLGKGGCCIGAGGAWRALRPGGFRARFKPQENAEMRRRTRKIKPYKIKNTRRRLVCERFHENIKNCPCPVNPPCQRYSFAPFLPSHPGLLCDRGGSTEAPAALPGRPRASPLTFRTSSPPRQRMGGCSAQLQVVGCGCETQAQMHFIAR